MAFSQLQIRLLTPVFACRLVDTESKFPLHEPALVRISTDKEDMSINNQSTHRICLQPTSRLWLSTSSLGPTDMLLLITPHSCTNHHGPPHMIIKHLFPSGCYQDNWWLLPRQLKCPHQSTLQSKLSCGRTGKSLHEKVSGGIADVLPVNSDLGMISYIYMYWVAPNTCIYWDVQVDVGWLMLSLLTPLSAFGASLPSRQSQVTHSGPPPGTEYSRWSSSSPWGGQTPCSPVWDKTERSEPMWHNWMQWLGPATRTWLTLVPRFKYFVQHA